MNPFSALVDLILPKECHICSTRLIKGEDFVCTSCLEALPFTGYDRYWNNKSAPNSDLNPMEQRFAGQIPLERACAPFFYSKDSTLASLIHDFKYRGFSRLATMLGHEGARRFIDTDFFKGVSFLIPIPLHWSKQLRRGYNQSALIAEGVSQFTGIPVSYNLKAIKPHRTQTSLTGQQRIENTKGIFRLSNPQLLTGKTIMLVDDICTTGATILSASETILKAVSDIRIRIFTLGVV